MDKSNCFKERFDQFEAFYLYGATPAAPGAIELLGKLKKRIVGFVDQDAIKQKTPFLGYPVISPDDLLTAKDDAKIGIIIVAAYQMEIYRYLSKKGVKAHRVFPFLDGMFYPTYADGYVSSLILTDIQNDLLDESEREYLKSWRRFKETADLGILKPIEGLSVQYAHAAWRSGIMPGGTCCDIGAFDGQSSIEFLETNLFNKIIAFEPFQENYQKLVESIALKKLDHVIEPRKVAIGAKRETFWQDLEEVSSRSRIAMEDKSVVGNGDCIEVYSLDSLRIPNISMIKVDIEGHELAFLEGAHQTIKDHRPHIAISAYHDRNHCTAIVEFFKQNFDDVHISVGHHPHAVYELEYYICFDVDKT